MNLKESKCITLALIEEFNPDSEYLTDDDDIQVRLNRIYNACMMSIARNKRIEKTYTFEDFEKTSEDFYQEFDIPSNCYIIKDIILQDEKTNSIRGNQVDYYRIGKKLYINSNTNGTPILRYYAYPKEIKETDTDEKYKFDLDLDVQYLLPYAVASDILKTDKASDYTAFENKYRMELSSLIMSKEEAKTFVTGGYNI